MKQGEIKLHKTLKSKDEIFSSLPAKNQNQNLKELLHYAFSRGVGMVMDTSEISTKPWTPELLFNALLEINAAIDLRTVQLWFQENEKGISSNNIRNLAKIFGREDPAAITEWQVALISAQTQLVKQRKLVKDTDSSTTKAAPPPKKEKLKKYNFALYCERLFSTDNAFNLQIILWGLFMMIALINIIAGLHSVTYNPTTTLTKQVGFLWAPTWTILPMLILPLYVANLRELLSYWKINRYYFGLDDKESWLTQIKTFSFSFAFITFVSVFFVFAFQWVSFYLRTHIDGDISTVQIDRNFIALINSEYISINFSLFVSALGYMYTALYIWILLAGLIFVHIIAVEIRNRTINSSQIKSDLLNKLQNVKLLISRLTLLGLWIAASIKIQVVYLSLESENIVSWLISDLTSLFVTNSVQPEYLNQSSPTHVTTLVLSLIICYSFYTALNYILRHKKNSINYYQIEDAKNDSSDLLKFSMGTFQVKIYIIIFLLFLSNAFVGQFQGFTILLIVCAISTVYPFIKSLR